MRRATMLAVLMFTLGAITMSQTVAVAEEPKKMPPPNEPKSYNEKVKVYRFVNGQLLKTPAQNVPMFRWEEKGELKFYTRAKAGATVTAKSEIVDEKGNVYVVENTFFEMAHGCYRSVVKLKPKN